MSSKQLTEKEQIEAFIDLWDDEGCVMNQVENGWIRDCFPPDREEPFGLITWWEPLCFEGLSCESTGRAYVHHDHIEVDSAWMNECWDRAPGSLDDLFERLAVLLDHPQSDWHPRATAKQLALVAEKARLERLYPPVSEAQLLEAYSKATGGPAA